MNENQNNKPYAFKRQGDTCVVSIANHADLAAAIMAFCQDLSITAGSIAGIGAVDEATLRFYDPKTKKYVDKTFREQMEVANLTGNISVMDGKPYIHLHCVLGRSDYTALAGHLLTARLSGACELVVTLFGSPLQRRYDPETGLNMYDL